MKKLLVLFGAIAVIPAYAYINESEISSPEILGRQGFSRSTLEVVDTVKYRSQGSGKRKQRYFTRREGRGLGKAYTYIKNYIDPIQDDGIFGEHSINYTNTWNGDDTRYSSGKESSANFDNL